MHYHIHEKCYKYEPCLQCLNVQDSDHFTWIYSLWDFWLDMLFCTTPLPLLLLLIGALKHSLLKRCNDNIQVYSFLASGYCTSWFFLYINFYYYFIMWDCLCNGYEAERHLKAFEQISSVPIPMHIVPVSFYANGLFVKLTNILIDLFLHTRKLSF